ncbi:uncharacterized protein METZ01_LOCUS292844, partial [marine metagenome]
MTTNTEIPPRAGVWQRSPPAEVGFDESGIQAAVAYACEHETDWLIDLSEQ